MGYDVVDRHLVVNETDAVTIMRIFSLYLEEKAVPALLDRLEREEIRTAARYSAKGNHYGNRSFTRGHLYKLLSNPIYVGRVPHKSTSHRGQHAAIIDKSTWDAVQLQLADNTQGPRSRRRRAAAKTHSLEGLLLSERGSRFIVSSANKGSRRYRYYVEHLGSENSASSTRPARRIPGNEIEAAVVAGVQSALADHRGLLAKLDSGAADAPSILQSATALHEELAGRLHARLFGQVRAVLKRVTVGSDRLQLTFSAHALRAALGSSQSLLTWPTNEPTNEELVITAPLAVARRGRQTKVVLEGQLPAAAIDRSLVTAIVRARDWADRLTSGLVQSMAEICEVEGSTDSYVGQVLPLAFLSPAIVESILAGTQPTGLTANWLIWRDSLSPYWTKQSFDLGATPL